MPPTAYRENIGADGNTLLTMLFMGGVLAPHDLQARSILDRGPGYLSGLRLSLLT